MSVPTAELSPTRPDADPSGAGAAWGARLGGGRLLAVLAVASFIVGLVSLLIPSTPSYDPWSWLVWGHEIVHGFLATAGGPSWKPLPMLFTVPFALFGHLQPDMWLVISRAGAAMAVFMCFRLAWRLTRDIGPASGTASALRWIAPLIAAIIAAGSLINSPGFVSNNALGYSEGLATALMLAAVDRFLDGHRRWAFVLGFFAALDRPELWIFWIPYGLWLAWRDPGARKLVVGLLVLNFLLWFGPDGLAGVTRAQHPRSNSAAFTACPLCTVFRHEAWPTVLNRIKIPAILGMLVAAGLLARTRRRWWGTAADLETKARGWLLAIGLFGFVWWFGIALETQAGGFSGNSRYLVLGTAPVGIAGAVSWGWLAQGLAALLAHLRERRAALRRVAGSVARPVGALVAVGLFLAVPPWIGTNLISLPKTHHALVDQAKLRENLNTTVSEYGGAKKLLACGQVMTEGFQVPMVAWTLGVRTIRVQDEPKTNERGWAPRALAPNVILQARDRPNDTLLPLPATILHWEAEGVHYRLVSHVNTFRLFTACRK